MKQWAAKYLLEHSDPTSVFEWLKNNQLKRQQEEDREELENALLDRNNPVINLGLALYGSDLRVGKKLYEEGNEVIKRAVLSGSTISPGLPGRSWIIELLPEILTEWNEDNLKELFSNSFLPDDSLVQLFEREVPYDSLDDEKWMLLCGFASLNDRLSSPYDSIWMDGWAEYQYSLVFTSAWWLYDKFPQTRLAANILFSLGAKLVAEEPHDMDVQAVIEKWRTEPDHENADEFARARSYLANLIPSWSHEFKALKDSDDLALRQAYYRNLRYPKPDDIKDGFDKDGEEFVMEALLNKHMFVDESTRNALKKACWDAPDEHHRMDLPNDFNAQCEHWASKHPEWFKDDWTREDYSNDEESKNTIDYLKSELEAIAQVLVKIHNKNSLAWAWAIAGVAIGYVVASL